MFVPEYAPNKTLALKPFRALYSHGHPVLSLISLHLATPYCLLKDMKAGHDDTSAVTSREEKREAGEKRKSQNKRASRFWRVGEKGSREDLSLPWMDPSM